MKILDVNPFNRAQTPNSRTLSSAHAREKPGHRYSPSFPLENLLIVYKTDRRYSMYYDIQCNFPIISRSLEDGY